MKHSNNKNSTLHLLQNIIGLTVVVWFVWYLWDHKTLFESAKKISFTQAFSLTAFYILTLVTTSTQGHILFKKFSNKVSWTESLTLTLATSFGNYLPMRAGTVIRARYMKNIHNLDYTKFGSIFSIRLALIMIASGLCGLAGIINLNLTANSIPLLGVFIAILSIPLTMFLFETKQTADFSNVKLFRLWQRFTNGIHELKSDLTTTIICFMLTLLQLTLLSLRFWVAADILNHELNIPTLLIMVSIANIASFTAITPGSLGIRESLIGYTTMATGETFSKGMLIGTAERIITLIVIAILGGISFIKVWARLNKHNKAKA